MARFFVQLGEAPRAAAQLAMPGGEARFQWRLGFGGAGLVRRDDGARLQGGQQPGLGGRRSQGLHGILARAHGPGGHCERDARRTHRRADLLAQGLRDGHAVARRAERAEQRRRAGIERIGFSVGREQRQRAAQATQAHAQLVHMRVAEVATGDLAGVDDDLLHALAQHGTPCGAEAHGRIQRDGTGLALARALRAGGEQRAALGLAAHVEPEAVARHPVARGGEQRGRVAAQQLDLEFAHRRRGIAGDDAALVEGQLQQRARAPHAAQRATDVGAVAAHQFAALAQQRGQALAHRRAGMQRGLGLRNRGRALAARHVVLEARHRILARGLQRLHPARALAAQAQRHAGRRQPAVGAVEVGGLQAQRARRGAAPGHRRRDGGARLRGHLELQLDLGHRGDLGRDTPCS